MTRPRHSYRRQARLASQIRHDRAALLAHKLAETRLQALPPARSYARNTRRIDAKAEYLAIVEAYVSRDPEDESARWNYHHPGLIEHRRAMKLPPIGWCETHNMPIHYPDWIDYNDVYPATAIPEVEKILDDFAKKLRHAT